MRVLIVHNAIIPAVHYGGIERIIWALGKQLALHGHVVKYLVPHGSTCPFAEVLPLRDEMPLSKQIPEDIDVVHCHFPQEIDTDKALLYTIHGNTGANHKLPLNSVFVSRNHAERYGSISFVHNGLDWDDYGTPDLSLNRHYFHFLGNAAWRVKNVAGAIDVARGAKKKLKVLGGKRLNLRMGFRWTPNLSVQFYPQVNEAQKKHLLVHSKGLIFPVRWHEPFGLAVIESLYFGCPVFATPYGALPELVSNEVGFLSNSRKELSSAILNASSYSPSLCHELALDQFNAKVMTESYLDKYEMVLNGVSLNNHSPSLVDESNRKYLHWGE